MDDIQERKQQVVAAYLKAATETENKPTQRVLDGYDVPRSLVRTTFGSLGELHKHMAENHKDELDAKFVPISGVFDRGVSGNANKYIITTAVAGARPHLGFVNALKNFAAREGAQIVVMPCESITNSFENETASFDAEFSDPQYEFVNQNTHLNDNICLCSIQVSAKQIRPITGLARIGNRNGSFVFASPKQFLEYMPCGNSIEDNFSIMTPGACTQPRYYSDRFVSKRLSYIAEHDHTIGAIVVEIVDNQLFNFRHVQADEDGAFIDFGTKYNADGTIEQVEVNVVYGDLHGVSVDTEALGAFNAAIADLNVNRVIMHDVFDGLSINHHVTTIGAMAKRSKEGLSDLKVELAATLELIKHIDNLVQPKSIVVVKSNHDEVIDRYVSEGRYVFDPHNHELALKIALGMFQGKDLLQHGMNIVADELGMDPVPEKVEFLTRKSSYKIAGVECGSHGDLGLNGAKASLASMEKVYGNCIIGHAHTAAIQRGVFRVGTMSKFDLGYNRGPSSWTHTNCLIYNNGQRQLVNVIQGQCKA
jgi:hypothetical protein